MKNTNTLLALAVLMAIAPLCVHAQNSPMESLVITMPTGSEFLQGQTITFAGVITRDASQYSQSQPAYSYSWTSSIDGPIGTGVAMSTDMLSPGPHTITLTASDGLGRTLSAEKTITVTALNLTVRIYSSESEGFFPEDEQTLIKAVPTGGIPPYSYAWTVDKAAAGSGQVLTRTFPSGNHKIELAMKDSDGSGASASIDITAYAKTPAIQKNLTAYIAEPANYQSFRVGSPIRFMADSSGGNEPYSYLWTSVGGGVLSKEKEFVMENHSFGAHKTAEIRLTVTDALGDSSSSSVTITLEESCILDGICGPGESYLNCPRDCAGKKDGYCDNAADGACDPDCARSADADCACNNDKVCEAPYENAQNCPGDCVTGVSDGRCDPIKDGRCDPDCKTGEDSDCGGGQGTNYFMLGVLVLLAIAAAAYLRFVRRR